MIDNTFPSLFPRLTLFCVTADMWNEKFSRAYNATVMRRLVGTIESSLSFRALNPFLYKYSDLMSIEFWNNNMLGYPERAFNSAGLLLAETGRVYYRENIEELREDYLVALLSGLKQ